MLTFSGRWPSLFGTEEASLRTKDFRDMPGLATGSYRQIEVDISAFTRSSPIDVTQFIENALTQTLTAPRSESMHFSAGDNTAVL